MVGDKCRIQGEGRNIQLEFQVVLASNNISYSVEDLYLHFQVLFMIHLLN